MRIQKFQDFIDIIRNKNLNKEKYFSEKFLDKLKIIIKECVPYFYQEHKYPINYVPNYNNKIKVDTSLLRNFFRYRNSIKKLNKDFDIKGLEYTYNNLSDEFSKEIFLKIIAYRLFDNVSLRFPIYYSNYFDKIQELKNILCNDTKNNIKNLSKIGYDVNCDYDNGLIFIEFIQEQYNYKNKVKVEKDDFVIDGGACSGDATLYFAAKTETKGKVYSFEFIDENLEKYHKNIRLNPQYKDNIELVEHPIWSNSDKTLYAISDGPGSFVSDQKVENSKEIKCISIDDFIKNNNIKKIDFIKFDIEGSELNGLKGAKNTIKTFKPKLAICIYHKTEDLWTIPKYIKDLVPEYELYINHHSINITESVLYAIHKNSVKD